MLHLSWSTAVPVLSVSLHDNMIFGRAVPVSSSSPGRHSVPLSFHFSVCPYACVRMYIPVCLNVSTGEVHLEVWMDGYIHQCSCPSQSSPSCMHGFIYTHMQCNYIPVYYIGYTESYDVDARHAELWAELPAKLSYGHWR